MDMADFGQMFREEAQDLLNQLEDKLMDMEKNPGDREKISAVFRTIHTIKGSSNMFGFDHITDFTHRVETGIAALREGKIPLTRRLIDMTLEARDLILKMLEASGEDLKPLMDQADLLGRDFLALESPDVEGGQSRGGSSPKEPVSEPVPESPGQESGEEQTWRIQIPPWPQAFERGADPVRVLRNLKLLGECLVQPDLGALPPLEEMDTTRSWLGWDVILTTTADENQIRDLFFFQENEAPVKVTLIQTPGALSGLETKKIGEILVERGLLTQEDVDKALLQKKRLGDVLVEEQLVRPDQLKAVLEEQTHLKHIQEKKQEASASLRVSAAKLDELVDLVGEMVTAQSRLSQAAKDPATLGPLVEHLARLTAALRENTMSLRMLPIEATFQRFHRTVRQLSVDLGKSVELVTSGGETEMDKTVLDRLGEPLLHLIRNALDHGIEAPGDRRAAGKPETGTIYLSAFHSGDSVHISIRDDGKGMDPGVLRRKALEKGLIQPDRPYSDQELYQLILLPGFSTTQEVTQVSGRGVGMDVVKKELEALGGAINIQTALGKGTEFQLTLPLTLAIIEGLLVVCGTGKFILPLSAVEACLDWKDHAEQDLAQRNLLEFRGRVIPFVHLRDFYSLEGAPPEEQQTVVLSSPSGSLGLVVDQVVGSHQTVIKKLGKVYAGVPGLSGASVLGDGSLALILDVPGIRRTLHG